MALEPFRAPDPSQSLVHPLRQGDDGCEKMREGIRPQAVPQHRIELALPLVRFRAYFAPAFLQRVVDPVVEHDEVRPVPALQELDQKYQALVGDPSVLGEIFRMDAGPCGELRWDCSGIVGADAPQRRAAEEISFSVAEDSRIDRPTLKEWPLDRNGLARAGRVAPADMTSIDGLALIELHPMLPDPTGIDIGVARRDRSEPGFEQGCLVEARNRTADRNGPVQDIGDDKEDEEVVENRLGSAGGLKRHGRHIVRLLLCPSPTRRVGTNARAWKNRRFCLANIPSKRNRKEGLCFGRRFGWNRYTDRAEPVWCSSPRRVPSMLASDLPHERESKTCSASATAPGSAVEGQEHTLSVARGDAGAAIGNS